MAEQIFNRVGRVISARIEDAVDWMENTSSSSVMREAMREVDRQIAHAQDEHDSATARHEQALRHQESLRTAAGELTAKARFALGEGREDLAQAAINHQIDLERQAEQVAAMAGEVARDLARLDETLADLRARKGKMEQEMEAYLAARLDLAMKGQGATRTQRATMQDGAHAEEAFDRAMAGAQPAVPAAVPTGADELAQIDAMQRRAEVAARLAQLSRNDEG